MKKSAPNLTRVFLFGLSILSIIACKNNNSSSPKLGDSSMKNIVAAMTLEEKASLVVGMGMKFEIPDSILKKMPGGKNPFTPNPADSKASEPVVGSTPLLVSGAAGTTFTLTRLGITPMILADGPAGLRIDPKRKDDAANYYCTAFPVATVLASTWDTELVNKVGQAMGNEVHEYGADILLAPAINIQRNPLCGRNFEYYSEDPLLTGKIAAAMIIGVQTNDVGTALKHFAANNQETNRNSVNTIVSERALREIYLEGFRIAIEEARPWTVMSSYNKINGTYTSESNDLLTKILRDDWGFKGFVMTDWFGGSDVVAQMKAGNDLLMPGTPKQSKAIIKAVKEGKLDQKILDRNVERILTILLESPRFKRSSYSNKPNLKAHALVTRQAATDGMVLLKNEKNALPLAKNTKKIAAFGNTSYEIIKGGTGSGNVNAAYTVELIDGLKNAGYSIDESLGSTYHSYINETRKKLPKPTNPLVLLLGGKARVPEMAVDAKTAEKMATVNDVALITIGRNAGEGEDRKVEGDFNLTDKEKSLIKTVSQAFHTKGKKAIVILNIGGVIEVASWRDLPDAILLAWQPGQEAGNSIVDVLSGKVNPSGKLTSSFPIRYADVPSAGNFPGRELHNTSKTKTVVSFMSGKPSEVVYAEDIYVGYRYYNTFKVNTAYEFGYGLSYAQFDYLNLDISSTEFKDRLKVTVLIKNAGKVPGREVVQLYLGAPAVKLNKPSEELKGFAKTRLLKPGEIQTVSFEITAKELASFDEASSSWIAEAGKYTVKVGASSKDIRQTVSFILKKELNVKKVNKALAPQRKIKKLYQGMTGL